MPQKYKQKILTLSAINPLSIKILFSFQNSILKITSFKKNKRTDRAKRKNIYIIKATKEFKSMFQKSIAILHCVMLCNLNTGMEIGAILLGKDTYIYYFNYSFR